MLFADTISNSPLIIILHDHGITVSYGYSNDFFFFTCDSSPCDMDIQVQPKRRNHPTYMLTVSIKYESSGNVPSAFWEMLNWGAVDRILWMGVVRAPCH
jgi:hypothetical protein